MRITILLLAALLVFGCGSKNASENEAEIITKFGVITLKEDVQMRDVEEGTGSNTSVYGGISSGGGFGIGMGVFLSPGWDSGPVEPVRYQVELKDGGQITVYHDSHDFEVGDCVGITVYPDEEDNPPVMKRNKDGC
jgi:hypothetical protein